MMIARPTHILPQIAPSSFATQKTSISLYSVSLLEIVVIDKVGKHLQKLRLANSLADYSKCEEGRLDKLNNQKEIKAEFLVDKQDIG